MKKPSNEKTSWISRLTPTLILRFLYFKIIIGCLDLDSDGNKIFVSFFLDVEDGIGVSAALYWLLDERPLVGLQLIPYPMAYLAWLAAYESDSCDT